MYDAIIDIICRHHPRVQAIYLFGSYGTDDAWPQSDVDLALLLRPEEAKQAGSLRISPCTIELGDALQRPIDLVNLRKASTVFQHEVIHYGRVIHCADPYAMDEFEMLTMSLYQKLNDERAGILHEFLKSKRAYPV